MNEKGTIYRHRLYKRLGKERADLLLKRIADASIKKD
jgi:hypothetical protein